MIEISVDELTELYHNNSNQALCNHLDITNPTLMSLLREHRIPLKGSGNRKQRRKVKVIS
ncbi:hypothetical protein KAR91_69755 [Candidatus Pacearchaeota archaeon]|nr:hypothetical protein [Candidatus Pacearchaeota archaeon]